VRLLDIYLLCLPKRDYEAKKMRAQMLTSATRLLQTGSKRMRR
jgi:hypothetical protein